MGRRRKGGHRKKAEEEDYDSDDPRAYEKEAAPDPSSREFIYDEVDEFHANKEKILLDKEGAVEPADSSDNEEEVLGWDDDDDEENDEEEAVLKQRLRDFRRKEKLEEMASDLEDEEEDEEGDDVGMKSSKAWGKRKQAYYDTDYVDDDLPGLDQAEEAANQDAEEQEALAIQTRMAEALQEEDFGLDIFQPPSKQLEKIVKGSLAGEEKVTKDLSKLSKREKLEILKKESPEFLELTADFKLKMTELIERLQPLVAMVKDGVIKQGSAGAQFIHTKYQLYLSYCMNISFYMILKSKHVSVTNHPVIGRILTFRKLITELQPVDEVLEEEMESLLSKAHSSMSDQVIGQVEGQSSDEEEKIVSEKVVPRKKRKREHKEVSDGQEAVPKKKSGALPVLSEEELRALEYYKSIEATQRSKKAEAMQAGKEEGNLEEDDDEDGKRGITYQISKNKGLTVYKRKELRNPRVKNRMKFRKAVIRRKGQVRETRTEVHRYGGEASGIRAGVIKSVKIR